MKVILIDDEYLAIEALKKVINAIGGVEIQGTYTNPTEGLHAIQEAEVDVVFLDIEMGASHGVKIAEELNKKYTSTKIVFVTAHAEYAVDAFEIRAFDYLLKPVRKERLVETLNRVRQAQDKVVQIVENREVAYLTVNAMGHFQLCKNATDDIKWRTRKVKELFAYIWHHYPNPISRSRIMEDLWGEQYGDTAVQLMHTSFYHLRKTIRDHGFQNPVRFANEQYTLELQTNSDLDELEQLMDVPEMDTPEIERVIELYQGHYFEDENYEWALAKQQQLKISFLATLEKYVASKITENDLSHLLEICLEKMLMFDPYNERFVYLAIDYYGKTKNLPKIIKIAGRFEELWTRELGITIPEEIATLYYKYITKRSTET